MTIHDDAEAARKAVYDTAFGKLQTSIDGLTLEKATLTGTVQELETERTDLLARIKDLETKPVEPEPEPVPPPANPTPKKIYGPTGKHWPSRTPLPTSGGTVWYAEPTWTSVADAITKASASSDPNATVKVRGGSLPGYGAGATAKTVLQNIGQTGRATKVLVIPADGKNSVTFTGSLRMHQVVNVAFVGFQLGEQYGIVATGCQEFSWAWSNARFTNVTNSDGAKTRNVEFVECVCAELGPLTSSDRNAIRNDDDSTSTTDGVSFIGGYIAPVQKKQGEAAHLDSLQLSGGNRFDNILLKDMPIFAASNQGIIATPTTTITLDHVLVVGGPSVHERYPRQEGAYVQQHEGSPWPLNGAPGAAKIQNESVIVGSVKGWGNSVYDASSGVLKTVDKAYLDAVAPVPTKIYLDSIWII